MRFPTLRSRLVVLALAVLFAGAHACNAQGGEPECKAADLHATFVFSTSNDHHESVVIQIKNISEHACKLFGGGAGAAYEDFKHGHNIWTHECFECEPDGTPNPLRYGLIRSLEPGSEVYKVYKWSTVSVGPESPCQEADGLNTYINSDMEHEYLIIAPTLITRICSTVEVSGYQDGHFVDGESEGVTGGASQRAVTLQTEKSEHYLNESLDLHVAADSKGILDKSSCPILFFTTRKEDGSVWFEESPWSGKCIGSAAKLTAEGRVKEDLPITSRFGMFAPGTYALSVGELAGRTAAGTAVMLTSAPLQFHFADDASVKRNWSPIQNGLAIALDLDRDSYEPGQDIHLHAAIENVSSTRAIYQPGCAFSVVYEVRDAFGLQVPSKGGPVIVCSANVSTAVLKGKPVALESTLRQWGILPDHPGEFTVVAIWNALAESEAPNLPAGAVTLGTPLEESSVIRSLPVTFHVTKSKN